jgi:tetratricopeptide (TPR) repeat protein
LFPFDSSAASSFWPGLSASSSFEHYKRAEPYQTALAYLERDLELKEALGSPLKFGGFPRGKAALAAGEAEYVLGVKGSAGTARVDVAVEHVDGTWRIVDARYFGPNRHGDLAAENRTSLHRGNAHSVRGYALYQRGRLTEALSEFDLALEADTGNRITFYWRGIVHHDLGDWNGAASDLERALSFDSTYASAHYALGLTYGRMGDYPRSFHHFNRNVELKPDSLAYYGRAVVRLRMSDTAGALADLDAACALNHARACAVRGVKRRR